MRGVVIKMAKINSSHIAIPTILKVEDGALSKIGPYLQESNLQKVVIYFGNGLIDMFGQKVLSSLELKFWNIVNWIQSI